MSFTPYLIREHASPSKEKLGFTKLYDEQHQMIGTLITVIPSVAEYTNEEIMKQLDIALNLPGIGVLLHENGRIINANEEVARIWGYRPEEIIGKNILDFPTTEPLEDVKERIAKNLEILHTVDIIDKAGNTRRVQMMVKSIPFGNRIIRLVAIHDLSDIREMKVRQRRLIEIMEASPFFISFVDFNGKRYLNKAGKKMLGYTEDENINHLRFSDVMTPETANKIFKSAIPHAIANGSWEGEATFVTREGKPIEVAQTILAHRDSTGEVNFLSTVVQDITEEKRRQQILHKREAHFRMLIEQATDLTAVFEPARLEIKFISAVAQNVLGYEIDECIGTSLLNFVLTEDQPLFRASVDYVLNNPGETRWVVCRFFKRDGSVIYLESIISNLLDNDVVNGLMMKSRDVSARIEAEQIFNEGRDRLEYFVEESREGIIIHSKGKIIDFNKAIQKTFGYSHPDLKGKSIFSLVETSLKTELQQNLLSNKIFTEEVTGIKQNGDLFDIEIFSRPHIYRGNEVQVIGVLDITTRKQLERDWEKSEERLSAAVEGTKVGIWDWNLITNEVHFNDTWLEIFGFDRHNFPSTFDEWLGQVHPQDRDEMLKKLRAHLYGETPMFHHIYRAIKKSESHYLLIEARGKIKLNESGVPVRIIGTAMDITERHNMEFALQESQARMKTLIENREEAIWSVDDQKRLVSFNYIFERAFKGIYGATPQLGKGITKQLNETAAMLWDKRYEKCFSGKSFSVVDEMIYEGNNVYVDFSFNPIYLSENQIIGVSVFGRNITHQKMLENVLREAKEEAETANKLKSIFLANMSHEIRTPMNGIMGFVELLSHSRLTKQQKEYIGIIRSSTESLLALINDLLDISKIEVGKFELNVNAFNLQKLVKDVIDSFELSARQKKLKLEFSVRPGMPSQMMGDETRVRQILINLLSNAIKFSLKGGRVQLNISALSKKNQALLLEGEVIDEGIGIAEKDQQVIFEPFIQITNKQHPFEGTGLGLSITKKLIELMGGKLNVESTEGKGSRFYFTIKLKESKAIRQKLQKQVS